MFAASSYFAAFQRIAWIGSAFAAPYGMPKTTVSLVVATVLLTWGCGGGAPKLGWPSRTTTPRSSFQPALRSH